MKIILGADNDLQERVLREMDYDFIVRPTKSLSRPIHYSDPESQVIALAKSKAQSLSQDFDEPVIIITSELIITHESHLREKPKNEAEARKFLASYNILPAKCYRGVAATNAQTGQQAADVFISKIYFNPLNKAEIDHLIKNGKVMEMEGGFDLYGPEWRNHIRHVDGNRDDVLGLPKEMTRRLIEQVQN